MAMMLFQGHGSFRFVLDDGTVVYVDPFCGEGYNLPADLILVTHEHFDHNQVDKMPHAQDCTIIHEKDLHPAPGEYLQTQSHGVSIQAVQAYNKNHPEAECAGFVLEFDGIRFYASGDTATTEDMTSRKLAAMKLDYATFPCDGIYTMNTQEASECARLVAARHSIPIHELPVESLEDNSPKYDLGILESFQAPGRIILLPGEKLELW